MPILWNPSSSARCLRHSRRLLDPVVVLKTDTLVMISETWFFIPRLNCEGVETSNLLR